MHISLGRWNPDSLNKIILEANNIPDAGQKIGLISQIFLGIPYKNHTLKGWIDKEEELTVNLEAVDCFTFIDYVEAMRLSGSFHSFLTNLKQIRYKKGMIRFTERKHFFTDWIEFNSDFVEDITGIIAGKKARVIEKLLNLRDDGSFFIPGIGTKKRRLVYIPSQNIDASILTQLRTGDYGGIYTETQGLDVSHVGIIIRTGDTTLFRHASSREQYRRVIDEDFIAYIKASRGLIVLRPRQQPSSSKDNEYQTGSSKIC